MRTLMIALLGLSLIAGPVTAKPALRDVAEIDNALLDLGIADRIRKECPTIKARLFKAVTYVRNLEKSAKAKGYSDAEIEAYTDSDAEKARMRAKGAAFFKAKGVDTSDPQSYCALGHAEIQKGSRIGSLLKAK
ncbi:MAG: DUF5333 domain-containing protein [Sulfitobacter sp.]